MREKLSTVHFFACICYICCIEHECAARYHSSPRPPSGHFPTRARSAISAQTVLAMRIEFVATDYWGMRTTDKRR